MKWLKKIRHWLFGSGEARVPKTVTVPIRARFDEDLPDQLDLNTLHVAGEEGSYWCAAMRCPCRCGEAIHLSLVPEDEPNWRLRVDRQGRPTLSPSVWRTRGCRSHFFLRGGHVLWCQSTVASSPHATVIT